MSKYLDSKELLDKLPIIDHGRRSTVFRFSKNESVKLYNADVPESYITEEFEKTLKISKVGDLNVATPLELIQTEGKRGIIFEFVTGESLMNGLMRKPWTYFDVVRKVSEAHSTLANIEVDILSQWDKISPEIKASKELSDVEKDRMLETLSRPHKVCLCHGDFHHGNLIVNQDNGIYILDWSDAFSGNHLLDIAMTAVTAVVSDAPGHVPTFYRNLYEVGKRLVRLDRLYISRFDLEYSQMLPYLYLASGVQLIHSDQPKGSRHREFLALYDRELWK
ncbi:aminoglycoside phosphotransferase family protein [bacterium]|nr:aminoglycoside phosphotransferase family protein [bacterium]